MRARFNGELDDATIVAWSPFDLDQQNRYVDRYVVLTETDLLIVADTEAAQSIAISSIEEATIIEGLGVDRLVISAGKKTAAELRYTRRNRREMTRLQRKLERRLPHKQNDKDLPPDWLEIVERREEATEHCHRCGNIIPAYAEGVCPRCQQTRKVLWRLLDIAKPFRGSIWIALLLTFIYSGLATLPAIFLGRLTTSALDTANPDVAHLSADARMHNLIWWSVSLVVAILAMQLIGGIRLHILAALGTGVARELRHKVYEHMHNLSLRFFAKRRTGSLITRVTNDTDRLWDFVVFGSVNLVRDMLMIVVFAVVMLYMNRPLAIAALLPVVPLAVVTYWRSMKMQSIFGRLWTYWSRMTAVVGDALPGIRVVKAFANEGSEIDRFDRRSNEYSFYEQWTNSIWATLQPIIGGTMQLGRTLVWFIGGWLIIRHPEQRHNNIGTLVMFNAFVSQFYEPIMELANSNRMVTRAATSAQRVFEVLDTAPEGPHRPIIWPGSTLTETSRSAGCAPS